MNLEKDQEKEVLVWEVCGGDLARESQIAFDKLLKSSIDKGIKTKLVMTVTIYPTEAIDGTDIRVCNMDYDIQEKLSRPKPRTYTARINKRGKIVQTGETVSDILQEELRLDVVEAKNAIKNAVSFAANGTNK